MPITTAPSNSNRSGTHNQAITPTKIIGNSTYIYKAFIKIPSKNNKKFFIFDSSFILFYIYNIAISRKRCFQKVPNFSKGISFSSANYNMEVILDGYKFVIETHNANNIILEKVEDGGNIISAIKSLIIFLHKNKIQYVTIYDCKKRDRYHDILLHIYKNANNTERWLYDMADFIYDEDKIRCKVY